MSSLMNDDHSNSNSMIYVCFSPIFAFGFILQFPVAAAASHDPNGIVLDQINGFGMEPRPQFCNLFPRGRKQGLDEGGFVWIFYLIVLR